MMAKSFKDLIDKMSPARRKDVNDKAHAILNDMALHEELQDSYDLKALRAAKKDEQDAHMFSFEETKKELGLS